MGSAQKWGWGVGEPQGSHCPFRGRSRHKRCVGAQWVLLCIRLRRGMGRRVEMGGVFPVGATSPAAGGNVAGWLRSSGREKDGVPWQCGPTPCGVA